MYFITVFYTSDQCYRNLYYLLLYQASTLLSWFLHSKKKRVGLILYYLKLLLALQRLYLVFNIIKLITTLKDSIPGRHPNLLLDFMIIDREKE